MTIQEILEAHEIVWQSCGDYGETAWVECECSTNNGDDAWTGDGESAHRAHVAEVLDQHMREREAAVIAGLAELLDEYRRNHDVAECAGYVEGEVGRQAVIDNWEAITEEPAEWLREQSKLHHERGFDYLQQARYEAWQAGEDAGRENGRNGYMMENGYIEDVDPIENPYTDEEPTNGR